MIDAVERLIGFDPFGDACSPRRYLLLDVFAEAPLEGNQLAVFADGRGLEGTTMQSVARELKLSETVFMLPPDAGGDARVRIFTPSAELPFAGHPVLGSAVVLAGALQQESVVLETGSGPVAVALEPCAGRARSAEMAQPLPSWERFVAAAPRPRRRALVATRRGVLQRPAPHHRAARVRAAGGLARS
jgi:PhzF family phenazine biosynthesis protein